MSDLLDMVDDFAKDTTDKIITPDMMGKSCFDPDPLEFVGTLSAVKANYIFITEDSDEKEPVIELTIAAAGAIPKFGTANHGWYHYIQSHLQLHEPIQFDQINFQITKSSRFNLSRRYEEQLIPDDGVDFHGLLSSVLIKIVDKKPTYTFKFIIPTDKSNFTTTLLRCVKDTFMFQIF